MTSSDSPTPGRGPGLRWRNRDHTRGNLIVSLLVLALPSLATSLSSVVFQLTDLTFISRLGEAPMAAVVIVNQSLRQTFFLVLMGGSLGTQALIARAIGAGDVEGAEHVAGQAIALGAGISLALMAIGGAMDLVCGARRVMILMNHTQKSGEPRLVKQCTYPLTGVGVVNTVITDLALIEVTPEGLVLQELAPGITVDDVQALTEPRLIISPDLHEMGL